MVTVPCDPHFLTYPLTHFHLWCYVFITPSLMLHSAALLKVSSLFCYRMSDVFLTCISCTFFHLIHFFVLFRLGAVLWHNYHKCLYLTSNFLFTVCELWIRLLYCSLFVYVQYFCITAAVLLIVDAKYQSCFFVFNYILTWQFNS